MGNTPAFNIIYNRYKNKLFNYLLSRLNNKEDASEVFQSVFIKLHKAKKQYKQQYPFQSWFFTLAYSSMIDYIRKNKQQNNFLSTESLDGLSLADEKDNSINHYELLQTLEGSKLTEREIKAIKLKVLEQNDYDHIALELSIKNNAARKLVERALKKIRYMFSPGGS